MTERPADDGRAGPNVNPGYASHQLAKALATRDGHLDPDTHALATEKVARWETILRHVLTGSAAYGTRTPVADTPEWVTLEVATGGFATGNLLAGGPLRDHELSLLDQIAKPAAGQERAALNAWYLTEAGLAQLRRRLRAGTFDVTVPEEGALLIVAWLVEHGHRTDAFELLDQLLPYFSRLRFYPVPLEHPQRYGQRVHLRTVGETASDLGRITPNEKLRAQQEAIEIWGRFHDRVVASFAETVVDGWPCQIYPSGWKERALALVADYPTLRAQHTRCSKPDRSGGHQRQLREMLQRCARDPEQLSGRDVGKIRRILSCYIEKRGEPGSARCSAARSRQLADISAPSFHAIANLVIARLKQHPSDGALEDVSSLIEDVRAEEARSDVPAGTSIPPSICRKAERCRSDSIAGLIASGLITSGDALAEVLPRVTSEIRATAIGDPHLRSLYSAVYRAFRRRRSLLLLNLENQVRIEELPWVRAIDRFRTSRPTDRELARETLRDVTLLTLTAFPHALLPNKLLQEFRALSVAADIELILVDELAADIFTGTFTGKFKAAIERAAELLDGSIYSTYYDIDYASVVTALHTSTERSEAGWFGRRRGRGRSDPLATLCASRAGVELGTWRPATNGMVIEQQQILTTQNLAAVVAGLELGTSLDPHLDNMAKRCFVWICGRLQIRSRDWHAKLTMIKNAAYAWRQMVFYLALRPHDAVQDFIGWARSHLDEQRPEFQTRFRPALDGLALAADGTTPGREPDGPPRFLGWCQRDHWLLREQDCAPDR